MEAVSHADMIVRDDKGDYVADAANLRDTAKWLAAPLAGLAIVFSAGVSDGASEDLGRLAILAMLAAPVGALGLALGIGLTGSCLLPPRRALERLGDGRLSRRRFSLRVVEDGVLPPAGNHLAYAQAVTAIWSPQSVDAASLSVPDVAMLAERLSGDIVGKDHRIGREAQVIESVVPRLAGVVPILRRAAAIAADASHRALLSQQYSEVVRNAAQQVDVLNGRLSDYATYYVTRVRFKRAVVGLVVGALVVMTALATPAMLRILANHDGAPLPVSEVTAVRVWLDPEDQDALANDNAVGAACIPPAGGVVFALGGSWELPVLLVPHRPRAAGLSSCDPYIYHVSGPRSVVEPLLVPLVDPD